MRRARPERRVHGVGSPRVLLEGRESVRRRRPGGEEACDGRRRRRGVQGRHDVADAARNDGQQVLGKGDTARGVVGTVYARAGAVETVRREREREREEGARRVLVHVHPVVIVGSMWPRGCWLGQAKLGAVVPLAALFYATCRKVACLENIRVAIPVQTCVPMSTRALPKLDRLT